MKINKIPEYTAKVVGYDNYVTGITLFEVDNKLYLCKKSSIEINKDSQDTFDDGSLIGTATIIDDIFEIEKETLTFSINLDIKSDA